MIYFAVVFSRSPVFPVNPPPPLNLNPSAISYPMAVIYKYNSRSSLSVIVAQERSAQMFDIKQL